MPTEADAKQFRARIRLTLKQGVEKMRPNQSAVDVVFQDLSDALASLQGVRESPKDVRRALTRFVELSQKLTGVMRKEFEELTGQKWNASGFGGWNDTSELFKQLRNLDQHEGPITIQVHERQYYPVGMEGHATVVFEGTWDLDDQLSSRPPVGMKLVPADPDTGGPSETETLVIERREYEFHLSASTSRVEALAWKVPQ